MTGHTTHGSAGSVSAIARRRPRPALARALRILSIAGLGVSILTLMIGLPALLRRGGGAHLVLATAAELLWTAVVALGCFAATRTLGARALLGAWFAGFFGMMSLAILVGRPVVERYGIDSPFAVAVWAPLTEELLKLLPIAILLLLARRNRTIRPGVGDAVLFSLAVGAGFALHEDALFGRGTGGGILAHPPLSVVLPSLTGHTTDGHTMLVGGHVVYAGLTGLGLAVTVLYGGRWVIARAALPLALSVAVIEHATVNRFSLASNAGTALPRWANLTHLVTLGGYLSSILLTIGVAIVAIAETRMIRRRPMPISPRSSFATWALPTRADIGLRGRRHAAAQSQRATRPDPEPETRPLMTVGDR